MRILQVTHAYPPTFGGVESHVWDISHCLAARGHDLLVLTGGQPRAGDGTGPVPVRREPAIGVQPLLAARRGSAPEELQPDTELAEADAEPDQDERAGVAPASSRRQPQKPRPAQQRRKPSGRQPSRPAKRRRR